MQRAKNAEVQAYKRELLALYRAAALLLLSGDADAATALIEAYFAGEPACTPS